MRSAVLILAMIGVVAVVRVALWRLLPFEAIRSLLDARAGDGSADPYTHGVHSRLLTAISLASALLLAGLVAAWRRRDRLRAILGRARSDARAMWAEVCEVWRECRVAVVVTALAALALRAPYLNQPMRFDEAYTWLEYASQPLYVLVAKYDEPNNHILHSVLVHGVSRVFGDAPWSLRLPAFLAGVLTAVVGGLLAGRWAGRGAALLAGLLLASASPLVEFSVNARGYTLTHLWMLVAWFSLDSWSGTGRRAAVCLAGIAGALALWTIPLAIYPAIVLAAWSAADVLAPQALYERRCKLRDLGVMVIVTAGLTSLLYLPVLVATGLGGWLADLPGVGVTDADWTLRWRQSFASAVALLCRDQSAASVVLLLAGMIAAGRLQDWWQRRIGSVLVGLLLCAVATAVIGRLPPARTWLFLWPLVACLGAAGLAGVAARGRSSNGRGGIWLSVFLLCVVWPAATMMGRGSVVESRETGFFPEAFAVVQELKPRLQPGDCILAVSPASSPLVYYGLHEGMAREHFDRPPPAEHASDYVVLDGRTLQTIVSVLRQLQVVERYRPAPAAPVFEVGAASVYRLRRMK